MTDRDWKLLKKAHSAKAVDNQIVFKMAEQADTPEGRSLIESQASYLRHLEEYKAGVL